MALVLLGNAVQDMRGKLNGTVYSRNKGGAYARTKVSPIQPRTPSQIAVRANFSTNAKAWSGTLTADQRGAWALFAAANPLTNVFGNAIQISGLAAYQQLNAVLLLIGSPAINDPPADKSVAPLATVLDLAATATGPAIQIDTTEQAAPTDNAYYIFATPCLAVGVTPSLSQYRFIGSFPPTASAELIDFTTEWTARFGALLTGKQVSAYVAGVNTATGALQPLTKVSTVVTA
jgi:hypothetical protein